MKQYKFDYIRETVEKWNPEIEKTLDRIEFVPFGLLQPWMIDYYGEIVDNFEEWYKQRHDFCVKLAKEYENLQNKGRQPDKS
jgi:hypothetical protein